MRVAYTLEQLWHDVPGGTATSALHVARRLACRDDVELVGVAGRHPRPPAEGFAPPVAVRMLPIARPWLYETWNRAGWPLVEGVTGPVDVCHSTLAIPAATRAPHVVTVHDVAFVHAPERFTRHGVRVMLRGLERCRAADLLLCPSDRTREDLVALGFDAARIRVVPWGVETIAVGRSDVDAVRARLGLPDEFALFVGTIEPRKNLARLVAAMHLSAPELPLVVAGADGWGSTTPTPSGQVRFVGFVAADELAALYAAATVFAYPSLEEGFGMPVAEAMAQGVPVVTSRDTATEEVAGGAAVLVDPNDVASIAAGITTALDDRGRWIELGLARAGAMSWDDCVEATVAAYREAAGAGTRPR